MRGINLKAMVMNLYQTKNNASYQVTAVPNIALLQNLGLRAGTQITVQNRYSLSGPILLRVNNSFSVALGKDVAKQIDVMENIER